MVCHPKWCEPWYPTLSSHAQSRSSDSTQSPPNSTHCRLSRCVSLTYLLPSTGKSQVLLCAATFKFRCHFIFLFSWSLAFSRPKNGPDRITGSHSAVKRRSQCTVRRATTRQRRHRVSDSPSAPLPHIQSPTTLCICPYSAHTCPPRS